MDRTDYKTIVNNGYKSILGFYDAIKYLSSSRANNKVSAAKEGIKLLKHWEKQKDSKLSLRVLNYYFYDFYKILEDYDTANEYYIKYNEDFYNNTDDKVKKADYLYLIINSYLSIAIKNNKVKDKKALLNALNYLEKLFLIIPKPYDLYRIKNYNKFLEKIYSLDTYKVKSYVRAKIISGTYDKRYLDLFTKEDFEFYLNYLKQTNLYKEKENCFNYVKSLYSYKYDKEDYENLCRYALFFTKTNEYESYNETKALSIFEECLNKGYQKSILNIVNFYLYKQDFKELISRINNFLKRKSLDSEIVLSIADTLFNVSIEENKIKLRYEKVAEKAANLYIKFEKTLNKERKTNLYLMYTFGLGVEKDLGKAKELVVDKSQTELITRYENQELANQIKIKKEKYRYECEKLIEGFLNGDLDAIYYLCLGIYLAEKFEENNDLYFKIASKYYEKNKNLGYILAQYYYFSDKEKYHQYLNEAVAVDNEQAVIRKGLELYDICSQKQDLREFNEFIEEKKQNKNLERAVKFILASVYIKKGNPKEIKEKGLALCLELNNVDNSMNYSLAYLYFEDDLIPQDLDKAFFYAKKYLELNDNVLGYNLVYRINKAANHKFISKEDSTYYLENSLQESQIFSSIYHEAFKVFSSNENEKEDYKKALKYLKIAAEFNYFPSMYELAIIYFEGSNKYNVERDLNKAFELFKQVYEKKYALSGIYLGCLYANKDFKNYNLKKAVEYFKEEYKTNKGSAAYYLGVSYIEGKGVEYNPEKAYNYFVEASNCGILAAKLSIAKFYYNGTYVVKNPDYETSYKLTKELIEKGYLDENNLFIAIKSLQNLGKDMEAFNLINELLKKIPQSSILHYLLGNAYRDGLCVEKNIKKAVEEYKKSNSLGGYLGYNALFYIYFDDDYLQKDEAKAEEVIKEGFKKHPREVIFAYCNYLFRNKKYKKLLDIIYKYNAEEECGEFLGELYYQGLELPQDYNKAFAIFKKYYENNPNSYSIMYRLGVCYFFAQGVAENKELAKELIYKSKSAKVKEAEIFWNEWISKK